MSLPELPPFPTSRPRRLRRTAALRRLVSEVEVRPSDLVLPMFVREGIGEPVAISSMPGVVQHSYESLVKAAVEATAAGVGGLMIFGVPEHKDAQRLGRRRPRRRAQRRAAPAGRRARRRHRADGRPVPRRVHRPRALRRARRARRGRQRRDAGAVPRDGARAGRSRRPPARHQRHDGRPGRRGPPGPRRAPVSSTPASSATRPSTPPASTGRSARR